MAQGGSDGPDDAPTHEDGQRSRGGGSSDHGEDREGQYAPTMVDVSSDSIDVDGEDSAIGSARTWEEVVGGYVELYWCLYRVGQTKQLFLTANLCVKAFSKQR